MGEREENAKDEIKEKDVSQTSLSNGHEDKDKTKNEAESKNGKNNGEEHIVDKNTQKILKSLSNGNGNKKPKK